MNIVHPFRTHEKKSFKVLFEQDEETFEVEADVGGFFNGMQRGIRLNLSRLVTQASHKLQLDLSSIDLTVNVIMQRIKRQKSRIGIGEKETCY